MDLVLTIKTKQMVQLMIDYRIDYLKEHIQAMKDAVEYDGVDLLGYTMWSSN